jgi:hypothetical protein
MGAFFGGMILGEFAEKVLDGFIGAHFGGLIGGTAGGLFGGVLFRDNKLAFSKEKILPKIGR